MRALLVLALVVTVGCAHPTEIHPFDANGLAPPASGYRIDYANASLHRFLGEAWRIDNYSLSDDERPGRLLSNSSVDLSLQHRRTHAKIWVDSAVIDRSLEQTELRVLAENWVASIANHGYFEASIVGAGTVAYADRRYAAELLDARALGVGGEPGYAVLVDIANLNQAEITPDERAARALVVFVRLPHPRRLHAGLATAEEPLLLIAGYANAPAEFDQNMPDFTAFVDSIRFVPTED